MWGHAMRGIIIVPILLLLLQGCGNKPSLECSNLDAQATAANVVRDQIAKFVANQTRSNNDGSSTSQSKIRATLAQLKIVFDDIRTAKTDPNSTKKFCSANLKIIVPLQIVEDADVMRADANIGTVAELADRRNIERQANTFIAPISYNVQPTDDGAKVFAEVEDAENAYNFFGELIASHLLRPAVANARISEQLAAADQQREEAQGLVEQKQANVDQAKVENTLATQTINAAWQNLSANGRAALLPVQRAWIKKKSADCKVEAAAASIDPMEREAVRLRCDSRATGERISFLQQYREQNDAGEEPKEE
jgi:uncharacterized protein YecT (DUF1311 family)